MGNEQKTGPRVLIMGLGLFGGGVGAAKYWCERNANVTITDKRDAKTLAPSLEALAGLNFTTVLGEHRVSDFRNHEIVVVNQAVRPDNEFVIVARDAGAQILTETGLLFQHANGPILAVTGSVGKSTTTALLAAAVQAANPEALMGGNIGISLLSEVASRTDKPPLILELSSFQLTWIADEHPAPSVAVVTNLSPNHLDWHSSLEEYYEAKRNLIRNQAPSSTTVLNADDPILREWAKTCPGRALLAAINDCGAPEAAFVRGQSVMLRRDGKEVELLPLSALRLPGSHNVQNLVVAAAAAYAFLAGQDGGFTSAQACAAIKKGISSFGGLPHRLEHVSNLGNVPFYNDSKSTTPDSAITALKSFTQPKVIIAGGYDKKIPFDNLGVEIAKSCRNAVLIGVAADAIAAAIKHAGGEKLIKRAGSVEEATKLAADLAKPDGVVIFSPACASFDMFVNYEERGEVFKAAVEKLKK